MTHLKKRIEGVFDDLNVDFGLFSDNTYDIKPDIYVQTIGTDIMVGCRDEGSLLFFGNKRLWVSKVGIATPFDLHDCECIALLSNDVHFCPTKAIIAF